MLGIEITETVFSGNAEVVVSEVVVSEVVVFEMLASSGEQS